MGALEIAIIVVVCAAFAAAVGTIIYKKVTHKGGCCGCDCGRGCAFCAQRKNADKKK